eukprot:966976-Pleurochrysis_carterae.AAC.1
MHLGAAKVDGRARPLARQIAAPNRRPIEAAQQMGAARAALRALHRRKRGDTRVAAEDLPNAWRKRAAFRLLACTAGCGSLGWPPLRAGRA